jgi:hypothetical protein
MDSLPSVALLSSPQEFTGQKRTALMRLQVLCLSFDNHAVISGISPDIFSLILGAE